MRKVLAGLGVILYPHLSDLYWDYRTARDLEDFSSEGEGNEPAGVPTEARAEGSEGTRPVAVLEIESIELELPVYRGTSDRLLERGAGLMEEKAFFGEEGTAAVTAHRSHTEGRLFHHLDRLEVGDQVVVKTREEAFTYQVVETEVYPRGDASYFQQEEGEERLLLITCHPLYHPSPPYRLVAEAERAQR